SRSGWGVVQLVDPTSFGAAVLPAALVLIDSSAPVLLAALFPPGLVREFHGVVTRLVVPLSDTARSFIVGIAQRRRALFRQFLRVRDVAPGRVIVGHTRPLPCGESST